MTATCEAPATGTITRIEDHGTIALVRVAADDGREFFVPFDQTPFRWLLDGEGIDPRDLLGRGIAFDGDHLWFIDEETT